MKIKFNQPVEFTNPKSKFVLTLFGKNDISVFMNDKEILNQNIKVFELKGIDFNNEFVVYGYQYGMNYLKLEFLLNNKSVTYDLVRLQTGSNGFVDIDVDSDNNNYFLPPDRILAEDKMEDKKNEPGKYVNVNGDDEDGDGAPDYADGFNLDGIVGNVDDISNGDRFIPIMIEIPAEVRLQDIKLTLTYEHSGAISVKRFGAGTRDDPYGYSKEKNSTLRIWTKDGNQKRNLNEINKNGQGDFVPPKTYDDVSILGFKNNKRIITLYMEGLAEKHPDGETIKVEMTFDNGDYYSDEVKVLVFDLNIGTDGNRDGTIDFSDPVDQIIDFWVNNDIDADYPSRLEIDPNDPAFPEDDLLITDFAEKDLKGRKDYEDKWIGQRIREIVIVEKDADGNKIKRKIYDAIGPCLRDLEDFAKLKLRHINKHLLKSNTELYLRIKKPNNPLLSIGIFKAFSDDLNYLIDSDTGKKQIKEEKFFSLNSSLVSIDKNELMKGNDINYLFEGEHTGKGHLAIGIKLNGKIICEKTIPIILRDIKRFYQGYKVSSDFNSIINLNTNFENKVDTYAPTIIYVHGWNMAGIEARWAETTYKRLYWLGFKGNVCFLDWKELGWSQFTSSEENAWNSAKALALTIEAIQVKGNKGETTVLGHSQGNILVGEFFKRFTKQNQINVKDYIASQGAISARFYSSTIDPEIPLFVPPVATPDLFGHYDDGIKENPYMKENLNKTRVHNFYNRDDYALDWWGSFGNLKPVVVSGWNYHYIEGDSNVDTYYPDLDDEFYRIPWLSKISLSINVPKERYQVFAHCVQSRGVRALGATNIKIPGFDEYFDLKSKLGFTKQHYSHSKQWRSNIIDERAYWKKVLDVIER